MSRSDFEKAKAMVMSLSEKDREAIYEMLLGDHVKNDVLSILRLGRYDIPPEEEREAFAKEVASVYVFHGKRDDSVPYSRTLSLLIDDAIEEYVKEEER